MSILIFSFQHKPLKNDIAVNLVTKTQVYADKPLDGELFNRVHLTH